MHALNTMLYGEMGRYLFCIKIFVKCIKYWLKVFKLSQLRLCRQVYDMMLLQMELGKENWAYGVKVVLSEHGFRFVWMLQEVGN